MSEQKRIFTSDRSFLTIDASPQTTFKFENGILELTMERDIALMDRFLATAPNSSLSLFKELNVDKARQIALRHQAQFQGKPSSSQGPTTSQTHAQAKEQILQLQNNQDLANLGGDKNLAGTFDPDTGGKDHDPNFVSTTNVPQPKINLNMPNAGDTKTEPEGQPAKMSGPFKAFNLNKI